MNNRGNMVWWKGVIPTNVPLNEIRINNFFSPLTKNMDIFFITKQCMAIHYP